MSNIKENQKFIILTLAVVVVGFIGYYLTIILPKDKNDNDNLQKQNSQLSGSTQVRLYYNQATGELYPWLPENVEPHTCVWTIWGDHGSEMKITTDESIISNDSNQFIKSNNFLPPRVPIYVTCVDWENHAFQGTLGEY